MSILILFAKAMAIAGGIFAGICLAPVIAFASLIAVLIGLYVLAMIADKLKL